MPRPVKDGSLPVGGRTVQVSSVAKPFFPDAGLTKGDLLAYYRDVAEVMLPHLRGRPLNLQRFPNGVHGKGFWQQGAADHFPDWVRACGGRPPRRAGRPGRRHGEDQRRADP
jgi:bifunctional non-homologous end joining protein LigD